MLAALPAPACAQRDTTRRRDTTITQPVPPRADSLLRDTLARRDSLRKLDSLRRAAIRADSVKPPLLHAALPANAQIAQRFYWDRDSLFATGALTLADLLERVPGVTGFHAGWISAPAVAGYLGDVHRVRVFYDGFEMQPLDPRNQGAWDLTQINLWSAEDVTIEQAPEEIRVYIRSWRVRSTTPVTRADVATGDQQTNLYRGFFGRRFHNGVAFQFGAQQYGTTPPSVFGTSSDQVGLILRAGWANARWSIDGFATRVGRHRGEIDGDLGVDTIPELASTRTDAYLRAGFGDPDASPVWAQAMAVASKYDYSGVRTLVVPFPQTHADSLVATLPLDTNTYRAQYVASGGTVRGPLRLTGTARFFAGARQGTVAPSARASFTTSRAVLSAFAEGKSADSLARADVTAQLAPLPFISVLGAVGRVSDQRIKDSSFSANYARAELGLRLRDLWLIGGLLRRDSVRLSPAHVFDTLLVASREPAATGVTAAIRGRIIGPVQADVWGVRWQDTAGFYRPRYQSRSELFVRTNLLERFPTGDFGLMAAIIHEYRSGVRFPSVRTGAETVPGYRTIGTLLEIRIASATISWQFRNFLGERYAQIPVFIMPRGTNFYGVRWEFLD